jgi:nucleoside phosphorylase
LVAEASLPPTAVVLTALSVERGAVLAHLVDVERHQASNGTVFSVGDFEGPNCTWKVAVAELGAGNAETAQEVGNANLTFAPRAVFFVGVAGGRKDVEVGDVVASEAAFLYESGKEDVGFRSRPRSVQPTYRAEQIARAEASDGGWVNRIKGKTERIPSPPRLEPRPMSLTRHTAMSWRSKWRGMAS